MKPNPWNRLAAPALAAAAAFVFWPALRGGKLWDDAMEVYENADLRSLAGLRRLWVAPSGWDYFPLKSTVQWLEWHCWGNNPLGYHLVSLGLHVLGAILVWRLLSWLARTEGAPAGESGWPWLAGLIFAVHPLAVESVAWISELKNTLSLPLLLLAFWAYASADERRRSGRARWRGMHLLGLGLFAAAMLSKSSVVMLPAVLLLYAWWRRGRVDGRDLAMSAGFFAISLLLGLVTIQFQHHRAISGLNLSLGGWGTRGAAAGMSLAFYLWKTVWPTGLLPIYPRWAIHPREAAFWLPWLGLAALTACFWARRRGWGRHAIFGFGWFGLNLLPVLGVVPMVYLRLSWVADHLVYLSLLGPIGLAAAGFGLWQSRLGVASRRSAWIAALVVCGLLAAEGHGETRHFRNEEGLWRYTLQRAPQVWAAHNNLGEVLYKEGHKAEAKEQFADALRLNPDYPDARNDFGFALQQEGKVDAAIAQYRIALRLDGEYPVAHRNLAMALEQEGRFAEAIQEYQAVLRLMPADAPTYFWLGTARFQAGQFAEAAEAYDAALRLDPDNAEAHNNLGLALQREGRSRQAEEEYETALRLKPGYDAALQNLMELRSEESPVAQPWGAPP